MITAGPGTSLLNGRLARGEIGARITNLWFDRPLVLRTLGLQMQKRFSRFGYFVMRDARQSIRNPRRKRLSDMTEAELDRWRMREAIAKREGRPKPKRPFAPSAPGEPPRNLTGRLKQFIFFGYDPDRRSVVIGPALLNGADPGNPVPEVLEHGGYVRGPDGRRARIEPRPYMQPAFDRQYEKQKVALWRRDL